VEGEVQLYVARGVSLGSNPRFDEGSEHGLLVFVDPEVVTSETQLAVYAERAGWTNVQLFQKGTISQELVEEKGDPHLSAWLDAHNDGFAIIAYRSD
jgi:hypothetical protein